MPLLANGWVTEDTHHHWATTEALLLIWYNYVRTLSPLAENSGWRSAGKRQRSCWRMSHAESKDSHKVSWDQKKDQCTIRHDQTCQMWHQGGISWILKLTVMTSFELWCAESDIETNVGAGEVMRRRSEIRHWENSKNLLISCDCCCQFHFQVLTYVPLLSQTLKDKMIIRKLSLLFTISQLSGKMY